MIAVLSPKGGTGKTTVSTNLAVGLARRHPGEVVLADFDLAFGDVAAALLLDVRRGLADLGAGSSLDDVLVRHPSGLHVLGAPDEPTPTHMDNAEMIDATIDALTARYPVVVVDTGAGFDAVTRAAAARATDLVLVASVDVPTVLGLRKVLRWLEGFGDSSRHHLVLNHANIQLGLDIDDVTATIGVPVSVEIPADPAVATSVNEGRALTDSDDDGPAARAFSTLVDLLEPHAVHKPGRLARRFRH